MTEEVEIGPPWQLAALRALQHLTVKLARLIQIVHREGKMKQGPERGVVHCHGSLE
jgi:hypothetical protein